MARALGNLYVVRYRSESGGATQVVVSVRSGATHSVSDPFPVSLPDANSVRQPDIVAGSGFWASEAGLSLGLATTYLALCALVVAVVGRAAPAISAERRGRTVGDDSLLHRVSERLVHWIDRTFADADA
ncbi:hypothetical protein GS934_15005 [Rhodococcus hoagii]|nr:hypothetical protein [Prescottella equi]NKZ88036.1 hypothetical protein [Prescottella equi]